MFYRAYVFDIHFVEFLEAILNSTKKKFKFVYEFFYIFGYFTLYDKKLIFD